MVFRICINTCQIWVDCLFPNHHYQYPYKSIEDITCAKGDASFSLTQKTDSCHFPPMVPRTKHPRFMLSQAPWTQHPRMIGRHSTFDMDHRLGMSIYVDSNSYLGVPLQIKDFYEIAWHVFTLKLANMLSSHIPSKQRHDIFLDSILALESVCAMVTAIR